MSRNLHISLHAGRVSGGSESTRRSGISFSPWSMSSEKRCGMRSACTRSMKSRGCKALSASCNSSPMNSCQCIPGRGPTSLRTKPIPPNHLLRPSPHLLPLSFQRKTHSFFLDRLHRRSRRHRASSQAFCSGLSPHCSSSIPRDETWHSISPDNWPLTDSEPESDASYSGTDSSCSSCSSIASLSTLEDMR